MISAERRESLQPKSADVRSLRVRELGAALDVLARMLRLAGDEALVAATHLCQRWPASGRCGRLLVTASSQ